MTVKARSHARTLVALTALLAASGIVSLAAQPARTPPRPDTPRLMVQVFGSADKVAGPLASDDLRERLIRAFPSRILWVIDRKDIIAVLEQSGYDTTAQLAPSDESQLAKAQRADEYLRGRVTRNGDVYTAEAWIVLTRDNALMQPLPPSTGNRADRATAGLVKSIQDARTQIDNEKQCMSLARTQKYAEAIAIADAAILEYPNATLVRYCKMNVLAAQQAPDSAMLKAANEILAIDPTSKIALGVAADAQKKLGNVDAANDLLVRLLATNPQDAALANKVVDALAASGKWDVAKRVVLQAVQDNPGDLDLISLQFRILAAAGDFKPALKTGEEMVLMDTSLANVVYFNRMVALYAADSQPQKAAESAARATQKFPKDADLWQLYAQVLKKAGQVQQSIAASRRALELNPKIPNGWTQIAVAYNELNFPDSALVALHEAKNAGDDANQVGGFAMSIGNKLYKDAMALDPKQAAPFLVPMPYLHFADSTIVDAATKAQAAFLIGVSHFYFVQITAQGLAASKSCDEAKAAQISAAESMIYTPRGGRTSPDAAAQILNALNGLTPYLEQSVKTLCK
ncbi:MAG: tetratricopeptide repeat protein [Gemmatimonadetes bacterium]|nr:tetratricopeptide repeat protein [Gemmatimonadota bacterium]